MSLILGIDTATRVAAGLARDGRPLAERHVDSATRHVEELQPLIDAVLAESGVTLADLDGICVGMGPGPFTGLRAGIVSAQVLASVLHIPLRHVCTLDALSHQYGLTDEHVVATDARRHELYWARYADGVRVGDPQVSAAAELPDLPVAGPGAERYADQLAGRIIAATSAGVDASVLAAVGADLPDVGPEPLYLRRPDATVGTARKSALVGKMREARR